LAASSAILRQRSVRLLLVELDDRTGERHRQDLARPELGGLLDHEFHALATGEPLRERDARPRGSARGLRDVGDDLLGAHLDEQAFGLAPVRAREHDALAGREPKHESQVAQVLRR
jgi:hypothetical protein